ALVEADVQRLLNLWFAGDQVDDQVVLRAQLLQRRERRQRIAAGQRSMKVPKCILQALGLSGSSAACRRRLGHTDGEDNYEAGNSGQDKEGESAGHGIPRCRWDEEILATGMGKEMILSALSQYERHSTDGCKSAICL